MKKVRFGVLGTARIGREKVIPALRKSRYCEIAAIASRSMERAEAVGEALDIPRRFGSYEALLAASDIDAVYIPLPNHLHVDWAIQAMRAGKHVLCEKPLGLDTEDINRLIDATSRYPDIKVMEALMYRHHPQWQDAKRRVDSGEIGQLVTVQSFFSYFNDDPANIRNQAAAGGGGLMDIGCYCVSLSRFLFGTEPTRVCGFMNRDPRFGIDRLFSGMLDFAGVLATFTCATQLAPHQRVNILGTAGRIELLMPFNAPPSVPSQIIVQREDDQDMPVRTITFGVCDQYAIQADQFARAVLDGAPVPIPLTDAWANMHTMEVLLESARLGSWVVC
ncbi:MAG: Gfo/Idh/MocA family oxidoreductase [Pseudodesulfovibrio sp.]|uniref:Oxidoreductase domain protein n=1 Tax=Pseudodesulfovibrio aespoeensis (strain ATCC 700646 / DSM 10631 / Aspo-2) TaxID=643562 RepID=E6VVM7_PSEA9|nr:MULTISPECIES: Gfo/Idh/MocA family oxidoreductase [Pseudodesulfovibrio]MBU4191948.1 Gfo/Idh/MocA family oxidoreductase [Pseudomonadota bacterium]ADU63585.1 oxidoreductase domain protein [Pseudodesulfovibrio aespoeensis Aspo-2]MBU4243559.1 Gfo/Idh/MocA family oxidoreductase [Pseudomonadota bacterium]MBU4378506.1 Gfo/Idh/MocA family oxidoreductase [Pseudomonadota bacterium]MBU4475306.1 Gfo/Idh/MocA family oxidoreductase [Pseudomonadota bacterium]